MLLLSNDPLARRQRLQAPHSVPAGSVWLADSEHRVVGCARMVAMRTGWIALTDVEEVEPFYLWLPDTVIAYRLGGPRRETAARPLQGRFRRRLLQAYGARCAVTGCDAPELLDAAHVGSWRVTDEGVLLRTDVHRMLDTGLAEIRNGRFRLLRPVPGYEDLDGKRLAAPARRRLSCAKRKRPDGGCRQPPPGPPNARSAPARRGPR